MIAALIILGLLVTITIVIMSCFGLGKFISGYKRFQTRDDSLDYAVIDYSTYKRLYQVNPDGYSFTEFGQLYRLNNNHGWTTREVRILFKSFKDYCEFLINRNAKKKADKALKRNQQETAGLDKLRTLAQKDIDKLRKKLDEEFKQEQEKNDKIRQTINPAELKPIPSPNGCVKFCDEVLYIDKDGIIRHSDGRYWGMFNG
mgnify:CR=1 FL=1